MNRHGVSLTHARRGIKRACTLIELLVFVVFSAVGIAVVRCAAGRFGPTGALLAGFGWFIAAPLLWALVAMALVWFDAQMWSGRPHLPICRNGYCTHRDYQVVVEQNQLRHRCLCGEDYVKDGRRVLVCEGDGSRRPYMVWRPFDAWVPDDTAV